MKEGIRNLLRLQTIDLELARLGRELAGLPEQEAALDREEARLRDQSAGAGASARELERQVRSLEGEVEDVRLRQRQLRAKLMEVKDNKQYQAMLREIGFCDTECAEREDRILELMEQAEAAHAQATRDRAEMETAGRRLVEERRRLADTRVYLEAEHASQAARREPARVGVPDALLALYTRLAGPNGGIAMARVDQEICQVCHVRLRPQMFQELLSTDILFQCESCRRILYVDTDVD